MRSRARRSGGRGARRSARRTLPASTCSAHVARDLAARLGESGGSPFELPPLVEELVRRGWTGAKAGRGFYQKSGSGEILALDPATLEYRASSHPRFPSVDAARSIDDTGERIRTLFAGQDRAGEFLRATLAPTLLYAARVAADVAHTPADVDRAMRWGFGWELGPFETLRAIGVDGVARALGAGGDAAATLQHALDASSAAAGDRPPSPHDSRPGPGVQLIRNAKAHSRVVKRNPGASLLDLGDGVLGLEFHSKMNAIGGDTIQMLNLGVQEAAANFAALVVGNDALNFSAGANLMLLLLEAQEGNWDEVDLMVRAFQQATMSLKHAAVPVVVCSGWPDAWRRVRDRAPCRPRAGRGGNLHRPGRSRGRPHSRGRRHEGDAGARHDRSAKGGRSPAVRPAGLRNHRLRLGLDERTRRAPAGLPARRGRHHHEPRAAAGRRPDRGACACCRLRAGAAAHRDTGGRRQRPGRA